MFREPENVQQKEKLNLHKPTSPTQHTHIDTAMQGHNFTYAKTVTLPRTIEYNLMFTLVFTVT